MKRELRNKEIIRLYISGLNLREIGKRVGLSRQGVLNVINKHGIKTRSASEAVAVSRKKKDEEIIQLWEKGYSKNRMMTELSLSWNRVNNAFKRMGVVYTTPAYKTYTNKKEIREYAMANPTKTQKELGEIFGISQETISMILAGTPHLRNRASTQKRIKEYKGESINELAVKYDISYAAASFFFRRHIAR